MELQQKNREELIEEIIKLRGELAKKNKRQFLNENDNLNSISEYYVPDHFIIKHYLDGRFIYVNEKARAQFNIPYKRERKRNIKEMMPEGHRADYDEYVKKLMQTKSARGYVKLLDEQGEEHVFDFISNLVEPENAPPYIRGIGKEVTNELEKKKWLVASKEFYKNLFEKNNNLIFLLEPSGTVIDVNQTALDFFSVQKEKIEHKKLEAIFERYNIKVVSHKMPINQLLNSEGKIILEGNYHKKGKFILEVKLEKTRYYQQELLIAYCRDITDQQKNAAENAARFEELTIFNETIRKIYPEKNAEQLLIRSLNIITKLRDIEASCIIQKPYTPPNKILHKIALEDYLLERLTETDFSQYHDLLVMRKAKLLYPHTIGQTQEQHILLLPIHIESKVEYVFCFALKNAADNLVLQLKLLALEINTRLSEALFHNKLAVSENRFKTMTNHAPSLLRMIDFKNRFNYFNEQWYQFLGSTAEEKIQKRWVEHIHPEDREIVTDRLNEEVNKKSAFEISYKIKRQDGSYRWLLEKGTPYYDNKGYYKGYVTSAVDITERKKQDEWESHNEMIRFSEERLQNALKNAITFAITIDKKGNIQFCNQFLLDVTGWKSQELLGRNLFQILKPTLQENTPLNISGFLDTFEGQLKTRKGESLTIRFNSIVLHDQMGEIASMTIVGEDITEQIKMTKTLHETNQLLQDLFDGANDLIFIFDEEGSIILVNNTFKNILDYDDEEIKNLGLHKLVDEENYDDTLSSLQKAKLLGKLDRFETVFLNKQGKKVNLRGTLSCKAEGDKPYLYRAMLYDYTSSLRAEKAENLYYQIARLVEKDTPLNVLYEKFYQLLDQAIGVESFLVALKDRRTKAISYPFTVNSPEHKELPVPAADFVNYAVSTFERPMFFYEERIREIIAVKKLDRAKHVPRVWLGVPLIINDAVVGMIVLQSFKNRKKFNKRDLELLTFVSGQLAHSILRYQHEKEINEQSARLESIFESGTHLMWSIDKQFRLTKFNKNFANSLWQYFHFDPKPLQPLQRSFQDIDRQLVRKWYSKYKQAFKGSPQQFEMKFTMENGEEHWREIYLNPIYNKVNKIVEVSGVAHDITQKKVTEIGLAESEEKFRNIFESFQDVYFRIDLDGIITMISPSIYELIGEKQIEVLGKPITNYLLNDFKLQYLLRELVKHGNVINFESQIKSRNGELKSTISNFRLIYDKDQTPIAVEGVARDITTLKSATEGLREAKEVAEKSLKVKKQFLSNMSHEIRTPMNGIIGMIDLLTETNLNDEQFEYVSTIKKSSETLLNILNDILDLSKIEAGKMELRKTTLSVRKMLDKLHALFYQQAQVKDTGLKYVIDDAVHDFIIADETRLLQILSNLTSNAIKFTNNGEILVKASVNEDYDKAQMLHFEVKDSGIGISQTNLNLLFKQFSQVDNSYTKSYGGTGLGLAISKQLTHLMDGEIGVESELNEGSTFWFTIKVEKSSADQVIQTEEDTSFGFKTFEFNPKILLVDDNMVNLSVAGRILKKAGCDISIAIGGPDAIEMIKKDTFDIIFMDIQMPGMNGITASKKIREIELAQQPPIIAMTAFSMQEEINEFLEAGLDDVISKPIKASALIQKVKKWFNKEEKQLIAEANKPKNGNYVKHILNVDTALELKKYGGDEILVDTYQEFESDTQRLIQEIDLAIRSDNYKEVLGLLHTIKGNAGTLGVEKLADNAAQIEKRLKNDNYDDLEMWLSSLKRDFKEFEKNYKKLLNI